jgi:hypothetical protein
MAMSRLSRHYSGSLMKNLAIVSTAVDVQKPITINLGAGLDS